MAITDPAAGLRPLNTELPTLAYVQAMWDRRDFAVALPLEEVRSSHQNTLLGNVWHLGNPLLTVAVYYLVFSTLLNADRGIDNYLLWLTIGVFTFRLTSGSVLGGAKAIASNQGLMRSIRFPRALLPVSVVISQLLTYGFELSVLAVFTVLSGEGISQRWVVLPVVLTVHTALNLGGAFIAARLNDNFRDVEQIIPFLFRLLQYLSGVMFPLQLFIDTENGEHHVWLERMVALNPMVGIIDFYRWVFLGTSLDAGTMARTVLISFGMLWFGFRFFRVAESRYGRGS